MDANSSGAAPPVWVASSSYLASTVMAPVAVVAPEDSGEGDVEGSQGGRLRGL